VTQSRFAASIKKQPFTKGKHRMSSIKPAGGFFGPLTTCEGEVERLRGEINEAGKDRRKLTGVKSELDRYKFAIKDGANPSADLQCRRERIPELEREVSLMLRRGRPLIGVKRTP
jgi:hypothetical protein